jgi:hypothetical protein
VTTTLSKVAAGQRSAKPADGGKPSIVAHNHLARHFDVATANQAG